VGRSFGSPSWNGGEKGRRSQKRAISEAIWDLSSAMGRVALGILFLVLIAVLIGQTPAIRDSVLNALPRSVADFFRDDKRAPPPNESKVDEIRSRLPGVFEDPKLKGANRAFGMGSTRREVIAVQGTPTRRIENTWYYGQSEVYFAGDRVVGWRNSAANPLRTQ
jgi:hypothetical protein